jgi:hypothetical protein
MPIANYRSDLLPHEDRALKAKAAAMFALFCWGFTVVVGSLWFLAHNDYGMFVVLGLCSVAATVNYGRHAYLYWRAIQ